MGIAANHEFHPLTIFRAADTKGISKHDPVLAALSI